MNIDIAQGNWETRTSAEYYGKIDRLDREAAFIDQRSFELTQPGADYDPADPAIILDALEDAPDLSRLAECLKLGDAIGLYDELGRIVAEYAVDAARAQAQIELGYGK